jgi:hypothetical protein
MAENEILTQLLFSVSFAYYKVNQSWLDIQQCELTNIVSISP